MQHPLTRAGSSGDFLMPSISGGNGGRGTSEDEASTNGGPANMLGLVSQANFLPTALHRHHQEAAAAAAAVAAAAFERPKFFPPTPTVGDKEFYRLKSQLDNESSHLNGNNNKYGSSSSETSNKLRISDFDVKGKNEVLWAGP